MYYEIIYSNNDSKYIMTTLASLPRRRKTRSVTSMVFDDKTGSSIVGSGMYGVVYKAIDVSPIESTAPFSTASNIPVALKKIKMERETQGFPITALREIKILHTLRHPNIVYLREIVTFDGDEADPKYAEKDFKVGDVFMVFEYVDYELANLMKSKYFELTPEMAKLYSHQLLSGVQYLHEKKILHRDIKGANLLITKNHVLKIADLGLARTMPPSNYNRLTNPVVTLWYRAPEVILGSKQYGPEIDIWSVGCIFAELKTKLTLFNGHPEDVQLERIFNLLGCPQQGPLLDKYRGLPDWEKLGFKNLHYSSKLFAKFGAQFDALSMSLLERMLDLNPSKRITAAEALNHEFFTSEPLRRPEELPPIDLQAAIAAAERAEREEQNRLKEEIPMPRPVEKLDQKSYVATTQFVGRSQIGREKDIASNPKLQRFKVVRTGSTAVSNTAIQPTAVAAPSNVNIPGAVMPSSGAAVGNIGSSNAPVNNRPPQHQPQIVNISRNRTQPHSLAEPSNKRFKPGS